MLLFSLAMAAEESERPDVPPELRGVLDTLPEETRDFLLSDAAAEITGSWDKLFLLLKGKSPEEVAAVSEAMQQVYADSLFDPARDMASIPLNTESDYLNAWKIKRPEALNRKREPGPIHLSYYMDSDRSGIRTFAGAPLAIYPEDLIAGEVDVAIVGAPLDMGSYYRGQRFGPQAMRATYYSGGTDMNTMINPSQVLHTVDYGDIA